MFTHAHQRPIYSWYIRGGRLAVICVAIRSSLLLPESLALLFLGITLRGVAGLARHDGACFYLRASHYCSWASS